MKKRLIIISLIVLTSMIAAASAFLCTRLYQNKAYHITSTQIFRMRSQIAPKTLTIHLNRMHTIMEYYQGIRSPHMHLLSVKAITARQHAASNAYKLLCSQSLSAMLQTQLLKAINPHNPIPEQFQSLAIYISILQKKPYSPAIAASLKNTLAYSTKMDPALESALIGHIQYAWQHHMLDLTAYKAISVIKVQQQLAKTGLANIILAIAYHKTPTSFTDPFPTLHGNPLISSTHEIPSRFTPPEATPLLDKRIPQIAKQIHAQAWVLQNLIHLPDLNTLIEGTQQAYATQYAQAWQHALRTLQFNDEVSLKKITEQYGLFTNLQSDLAKAVFMIQNQLEASDNPVFREVIAHYFQSFFDVITVNKQMQLAYTVQGWQDTLQHLANTQNPDQAILQLTATLMTPQKGKKSRLFYLHLLSQNLPEPFSHLINQLNHATLQFLLLRSYATINARWQNHVLPQYANALSHHYPFNLSATSDLDMAHFNRLFKVNSPMDQFIQKDVYPFFDTHKAYWQPYHFMGQQLTLHPEALNQLIKFKLIQKMFFSIRPDTASFIFGVEGTALSHNVSQATLHVDGQTAILDDKHQGHAIKLLWPGPKAPATSLRFINPKEANPSLRIQGTWSLFRLLAKHPMHQDKSLLNYHSVLSLGDDAVDVRLSVPQPISPFLPGVLMGYQPPASL